MHEDRALRGEQALYTSLDFIHRFHREAFDLKGLRQLGKIRIIIEINLGIILIKEDMLPLTYHAEHGVIEQNDFQRNIIAVQRR